VQCIKLDDHNMASNHLENLRFHMNALSKIIS
jgi:hypothetical protein